MANRSISELTFGTVLAFVAPGFLGLLAVSYQLPAARAWIEVAQSSEQSVGVFLFVALASIICGVIISGLRDLSVNVLFCWIGKQCGLFELPKTGFGRLTRPSTLAAFEAAVENYYRYYQFYGNTAVSLVLLAISRASASKPPAWPKGWPWVTGALILLLSISAFLSLKRYATTSTEILAQPSLEDAQ